MAGAIRAAPVRLRGRDPEPRAATAEAGRTGATAATAPAAAAGERPMTRGAGSMAGSGTLIVDGGNAGSTSYGGGGSGGRIALAASASKVPTSLTVSASAGGNGANNGAAGTIYTQGQGQSPAFNLTLGGSNY